MPVKDGLEFIKQRFAVENAKGVPVVMITTEGTESHVVQALCCGARVYIRKPFTPEQVREHDLRHGRRLHAFCPHNDHWHGL